MSSISSHRAGDPTRTGPGFALRGQFLDMSFRAATCMETVCCNGTMESSRHHGAGIVSAAKRVGPVGPRMQSILDALPLLNDSVLRTEVLGRVSDPYLLECWSRDFGSRHVQYRADAIAPVQTRISYYFSPRPRHPRATPDGTSRPWSGRRCSTWWTASCAGRVRSPLSGGAERWWS